MCLEGWSSNYRLGASAEEAAAEEVDPDANRLPPPLELGETAEEEAAAEKADPWRHELTMRNHDGNHDGNRPPMSLDFDLRFLEPSDVVEKFEDER
jgi:hypothetical protein